MRHIEVLASAYILCLVQSFCACDFSSLNVCEGCSGIPAPGSVVQNTKFLP